MQFLKQSTAVTVKIGPFLDDSDGKTAETGLTISQADVRLSKNGGAFAQKNDATACTHDENGWYGCPLDATDTGTPGRLKLAVNKSAALPVWHDFVVLPEHIYDWFFGAGSLYEKAAKLLVNKAVQTKATGAIEYYDDDGETVILRHTPTETDAQIIRTPSSGQ